MVERIIELSVKNRFILIFITLLLAFGSIYAIKNTSLDAIPDLSANQVIIEVEWSNQSAKTIEEQISYPLIFIVTGKHHSKARNLRMRKMRQKLDRKSTRLNSSHITRSRMPSSA